MKRSGLLLICILTLFVQKTTAQNAPSHLRISLLTCGPGDELYSTFGHTAIRIMDSTRQTDIVYNYGNFNFDDPDFYMKFVRGKLDYFLNAEGMIDFMPEYQQDKRSVTEQLLILPDSIKLVIVKALNENLIGAARYYKYDYLYDNCTTRVREILLKYAGLQVIRPLVPAKTTFRNLIHEYLDRGGQTWSKLGIDLLLGSTIDKVVDIPQSMFLPDYLMKGVDSSVNTPHPILQQKTVLNIGAQAADTNHNLPVYIFSVFAVIVMAISFAANKAARRIVWAIDIILFVVTGLLGCLFLFLWFGSDSKAYSANYNVLWALPTNLIAAFVVRRNTKWVKTYFSICSFIYAFTLIFWPLLPQQFNIALIPILILLLFRCWQLRKNN